MIFGENDRRDPGKLQKYKGTREEPLYGYLHSSILLGFFHKIVDFSTKLSLVYQNLFCLVSLLVFAGAALEICCWWG